MVRSVGVDRTSRALFVKGYAPETFQLSRMDIFDVTGSFGRWQLWVFMVLFYINVVGIWQNLSITFLAPNMDFKCVEPLGLNDTAPAFDSRCSVALASNQSGTMVVPCTKWEYDTSQFSDTLVSEFDLVCNREWLVSLAKSVYMVGFLVSVIFFGQLSDSIGRFPSMAIAYVITVVSMLLSLLSTSYVMFVILRFFQAFGRTGLTTIGFVLIMEIVGPQHRTAAGIFLQLGWSLGFMTLAGVAYLFRHWFWLQVAMAIPIMPIILTYSLVPESPRWLLMRGKVERLEKTLTRAAAVNGKDVNVDHKDIEMLKDKAKEAENKSQATLFDLFKTPKLRNRTFYMIYLWMVNAFVYYALAFNTNDLAGDPYLNFFVAGALEFPSYGLLYWGIRKFGRRPTLVALMLVGGSSCLAIIPVPQELAWVQTSLSMMGKFCVTASFGLLYLYTSELFPTVVRNAALGSCSMCGRIGSIIAPFVKELGQASHPSVPNVIYGVLAISSGFLSLLLPETKGQSMPDTLEEGENFGQSKSKEAEAATCSQVTAM